MIRRLRVRGYKSLADCQVVLHPLSVVFGPNGAGKSNLLDLISLLSRLATRETVREAFEGHRGRPVEAFHSPGGFPRKSAKEAQELGIEIECDLGLHQRVVAEVNRSLEERERIQEVRTPYTRVAERLVRYRVRLCMSPSSGELFVEDESLHSLRSDLTPKTSRKPFLEKVRERGEERFVARIERQSHPRYFESRRPRTLLSELSDPVYHPHVVAAAREIGSWRVYYVQPNRILDEVGVQAADDPGRSGELLAPYLFTLQRQSPRTLAGIVRNMQRIVPGFEGIRVDIRDGLLEMIALESGGREFPARLLSEGTLRLLCILSIAVSPRPPALVAYEEPENGVNPARLDLIGSILKTAAEGYDDGPQVLVTTHSPRVCDILPEHLILCRWTSQAGTTFDPFPWDPTDLYFQDSVVRSIDQFDATLVAEPGPGSE